MVTPAWQAQDDEVATEPDPPLLIPPHRSVPLPARLSEEPAQFVDERAQRRSRGGQTPRSVSRTTPSRNRMQPARRRKGHPMVVAVLALVTLAAVIGPIIYVAMQKYGGGQLPGFP